MPAPNSTQQQQPAPFIRNATPADSPAVSRICLLTGDAGKSAESLHSIDELLGLMWAEPYLHIPEYCWGFVLADPSKSADGNGEAVGYILGAFDTRAYEAALKTKWFPPYLEKYPLSAVDGEVTDETPAHLRNLTAQDKFYIRLIHNPWTAENSNIAFSPAHLHIDILPEYQRQGWGKKLIGTAVKYLKEEKGLDGLWLGLDPRNVSGRKFYERIGFESIPGAPDHVMGLKFENWRD